MQVHVLVNTFVCTCKYAYVHANHELELYYNTCTLYTWNMTFTTEFLSSGLSVGMTTL